MHQGKIKYYRGQYGYIASPDFRYSLYFTKSDIHRLSRPRLKRGDDVSFEAISDPSGKNRKKAMFVKYIGFTPFTFESLRITSVNKEELIVGRLISWDGMKGLIRSSRLQLMDTFLYYSRVVNAELQNNQTIVFKPVASKDPRSTYFAYFAYPIELEDANNLLYMYEQDGNHDYPELDLYIKTNFNQEWLIQNLKWMASDNWTTAKKIWNEYESKYSAISPQLIEQLPNTFQIYAWENNLTTYINSSLLIEYFQKSNKEQKAFILQRLNNPEKHKLLGEYFNWFFKNKRYLNIHSDLKPFINFFKEYGKERLSEINSILMEVLTPPDLLRLWLDSYIDTTLADHALEYLLEYSSVNDMIAFLKISDNNEFNKGIYNRIESILVNFLNPYLKTERLICISYFLNHLYKKDTKKYELDLLPIIKKGLTSVQLLILMAYDVHLDIDINTLLSDESLNLVYLIKLDLLEKINLKKFLSDKKLEPGEIRTYFIEDLSKFPWSDQIEMDLANFLLSDYQKWYDNDIDRNYPTPAELAVELYYLLTPVYNLQHLRLCLAFQQELGKEMDYYHFRFAFNELSRSEKKRMRDILLAKNEKENNTREREFVHPCIDFIKLDDNTFEYYATIINLYFEEKKCSLRLNGEKYSNTYKVDEVNASFNMIGSQSKAANIPLIILMENNDITEIQGLDEVLDSIEMGGLAGVLSTTVPSETSEKGDVSYAQDYSLKAVVLEYLQKQQIPNELPLLLYEYDNLEGRHKNEESLSKFVKGRKLSKLFTVPCGNHLAIIWESINFEASASTFIFKTTPEKYHVQISRINTAVSSYKNLRSYLKYTFKADPERQLKLDKQAEWHHYLGYIGNMLKPRGGENAFESWKRKLDSILLIPCPDIENASIPEVFTSETDYGLIIRRGKEVKEGTTSRDAKVAKVDKSVIDGARGAQVPEKETPYTDKKREAETEKASPAATVLPSILQSIQSLHQQFLNNIK